MIFPPPFHCPLPPLYEFPPIRYDSVSPERELLKYQYPKEVESVWNSIYEKRNSERQVMFPYIEPSMVVGEIKQGKFIEFNHEEQDLELDEFEK